jgi:hypothetical protein
MCYQIFDLVFRFTISFRAALSSNRLCRYCVCLLKQRYELRLSRAGGGKRLRTDDLLLAKQALYQLSYAPV